VVVDSPVVVVGSFADNWVAVDIGFEGGIESDLPAGRSNLDSTY